LDARSLAQPCYLPEEIHKPPEGERNKKSKRQRHPSNHDMLDWGEIKGVRP